MPGMGSPPGTGNSTIVGAFHDALVRLTVWAWSPTSAVWSRGAVITVPIQYGSSS
jgi:hypothetical protein